MVEEPTAEQFVVAIAQRDEATFGRFYDQYAPQIYGMVCEIVEDRDAAREVLREVFVRLWKEARHIDAGRVSVPAWLTLMARAQAVDRQRAHAGLDPLAQPRMEFLLKSDSWMPRPEEIAQVEKRRGLLEKIANRLPAAQSRLVKMAVFKGSNESEIAEQIGEPPGKVESELRAGLRFLRHRLRAVLGTWTADI